MLRFMRSKKVLFIVVIIGFLLVIALWQHSASDWRLRAEAEESPLSCALYAAKKRGNYNSEIVCKVAMAFAEVGDFDRAQQIINEVKETEYFKFYPSTRRFYFSEQLDFNLGTKVKALVTVAGLYARAGHEDKALKMLSQALQIGERIEIPYVSSEAMTEIISKYVELGADSQALKVIDSAKPARFSDGPEALAEFKHRLFVVLADKYLDIGKGDQAFEILGRAKQTIAPVKDTSIKSVAFAQMGTLYAKAGQSHKADELLSEALEVITADTSRSEPDKSATLTAVTEEYAKSGFCQRAYELSKTVTVEHNAEDCMCRARVASWQ